MSNVLRLTAIKPSTGRVESFKSLDGGKTRLQLSGGNDRVEDRCGSSAISVAQTVVTASGSLSERLKSCGRTFNQPLERRNRPMRTTPIEYRIKYPCVVQVGVDLINDKIGLPVYHWCLYGIASDDAIENGRLSDDDGDLQCWDASVTLDSESLLVEGRSEPGGRGVPVRLFVPQHLLKDLICTRSDS